MADLDTKYDVTPLQTNERPRGPSIAAMQTALNTADSTTYSQTNMLGMSKLDLQYACKVLNLTVAGL